MRMPRASERCSLWPMEMRALWDEACVSKDHDLTKLSAKAREIQMNHVRADALLGNVMVATQLATATRPMWH